MKLILRTWERLGDVLFGLSGHRPIQLAVYRICFAGYVLVSNQMPSVRWIPGVPQDFRNPPPGLTSLLPHPSPAAALAVEVAMVLSVVGLLLGWRTRSMSFAVGILGIVGSAMIFSFGKIDHNIFLWIVPLVMSSSAWGERVSVDGMGQKSHDDDPVATPAIPFLSVLLALGFLTAGLPKLAGNWLSTESSATQSYFIDKVLRGETNVSTSYLQNLDSRFLWESADWATVVLELGFAAMVLWPFGYRLLVNVAALFHLIVLFVLNINFESSLVLYVVFALQLLDVDRLEARLKMLAERRELVIVASVFFLALASASQLAGDGLLRVSLGLIGADDWAASLITQLAFSGLILRLTLRSLRPLASQVSMASLRQPERPSASDAFGFGWFSRRTRCR